MTTLMTLALLLAGPVEPTAAPLQGYASAYAPGVFETTVAYRHANAVWRVDPPYDWYTVAGYVAVNDCRRVGERATLVDPGGRSWPVLVADCAGNDGTPGWMAANNIVVELDARLWGVLTATHARPLRVELRP